MGKDISVATAIEKNRISSEVPFLTLLEVTVRNPETKDIIETIYLVLNDEDIVYNGQTYNSDYPFDVTIRNEAGSLPQISLSITDTTQTLEARLQAYKGIVGSDVTITVVSSAALNDPPEIQEKFQIEGVRAKDYDINFTLGVENALALTFPKRRQMRDRCGWKYKSTECGYTGGLTTCDLSLQGANGCSAHANSRNFGGFPGINPNLSV